MGAWKQAICRQPLKTIETSQVVARLNRSKELDLSESGVAAVTCISCMPSRCFAGRLPPSEALLQPSRLSASNGVIGGAW